MIALAGTRPYFFNLLTITCIGAEVWMHEKRDQLGNYPREAVVKDINEKMVYTYYVEEVVKYK